MQYNANKEIWYPDEKVFENPLTIDDYERFLSDGISKRIKDIHTELHISCVELYSDKPSLIKQIIEGKYSYFSFVTNKVLSSIIHTSNATIKNYKGNNLPEKITRFWIIFGDEQDIREFLKQLYYNICLNILSDTYKKYREEADKILDLFYADANFSFIYGQAKIDDLDMNEKPNVKERRALVSAIKYTWNIISDEILKSFRDTFDRDNDPFYKIKNSKDIPQKLDKWCEKILMPYLIEKKEKLKKDSIANIGYCVHYLMETLYEKKIIEMNDKSNEYDEYLKVLCDKSDNYLLYCAKKLEESQCTYFTNVRNCELEKSISESIDESKDYEFEDAFISDSGDSFEKIIEEAIKNCKK